VKLTAVQAVARCAWEAVPNKVQKQKLLMSEATGITLPANALKAKMLSHGGPCFCAIKL